MLQYLVCVKQVPDSTQMRIDRTTGTLIRTGVPAVLNPYDVYAVSAAVEVKRRYGGKVTALTMGPPAAEEALKECVAMGCDEAIHLTDRLLAGADTLATTYALWRTIQAFFDVEWHRRKRDKTASEQPSLDPLGRKKEPLHLIFTGKQTIDGDTAQVGPGIATRVEFTQLTYVCQIQWIDFERNQAVVHRQVEKGIEIVEARLPALFMVLPKIAPEVRVSPARMLWASEYKPIVVNTKIIDMDPDKSGEVRIGLKGSPTIVKEVFVPEEKKPGIRLEGSLNEMASFLLDALQERVKWKFALEAEARGEIEKVPTEV